MTTISTSSTVTSTQSSYSVERSDLSVEDAVTNKVQPILDRANAVAVLYNNNTSKISAYEEMQSLLLDLSDAADALAAASGDETDSFSERSATLTASSSSSSSAIDASTLLSVSVDAGTTTGTHTVTVEQLATAERAMSSSQSSRSDALGYEGSFTIAAGDNTAATVDITSDMSLDDIVSAINDVSDSTGVTASVLKISDDEYTLVLTASDTNQEIALSTTSGSVLSDLGITESDGSTLADVIQEAQPAIITVDGVTVTRDSNEIDDVLDGVTFDLTKADPDTTITVDIEADTDAVTEAINDFVDAYNAWRDFVDTNTSLNDDGDGASSDATLFGDSTLYSVATSIDSALTDYINGLSLGSIGILLNEDNNLEIDDDTLADALSSNYDNVQSMFKTMMDSIYDTTQAAANEDDSSLQSLIDSLNDQNDGYQDRYDTLIDQANSYYEYLLDRYGDYEATISYNNQMADIIQELMNYDSSSSSS